MKRILDQNIINYNSFGDIWIVIINFITDKRTLFNIMLTEKYTIPLITKILIPYKSIALDYFYKWKNRIRNEPLDLVSTQLWCSWCDCDTCMVCKNKHLSSTYEVNLQWGDTDQYEYIREMCFNCIRKLNYQFIRNKNPKFFTLINY
jgi:hypothetical protein